MGERNLILGTNNAQLTNIIDNNKLANPFIQKIYLYSIELAGIRYYLKKDTYLNENDTLILKREPKNEYDKYAISVFNNKNEKLGYIPRTNNKVFARLMDSGKVLSAEIREIDHYFDEIRSILIRIYLEDF